MTKEFENDKIWKGKWDQYAEQIVKAENNRTLLQAIENLENWVYRHFIEKEEIKNALICTECKKPHTDDFRKNHKIVCRKCWEPGPPTS